MVLFVILLSSLHVNVRATPRYLIGYLQCAKNGYYIDLFNTIGNDEELFNLRWINVFTYVFTLECYDVRHHETTLIILRLLGAPVFNFNKLNIRKLVLKFSK